MTAPPGSGPVELVRLSPDAEAAAPLTEQIHDTLARVAADSGCGLSWFPFDPVEPGGASETGIPDARALGSRPEPRIAAAIVAQFEAALRTALLHASRFPLRLLFLLNQEGRPQGPESLIHGTFRGRVTRRNYLGHCEIRLKVPAGSGMAPAAPAAPHGEEGSQDSVVLWIDDPTVPDRNENPYRSRPKDFLARRYPVLLDLLRQRASRRQNREMLERLAAWRKGHERVHVPPPPEPQERTILFCLFWLDHGGAEAFALSAMRAARQAGYRVVVTCDEPGRHRLLAAATEQADAIYLLGSFGFGLSKEDALLRVIRHHRPALIHIHHSWAMYRLLPVVRTMRLVPRIIDTLHILEQRYGGFVLEGALYSEFLDAHHVISQSLATFLEKQAAVPPQRVVLGKLHDLSERFEPAAREGWDREGRQGPLRLAFVGRFVQQKRPFLFIEVARRLVRRFGRERFRFDMVGEGELRRPCEEFARHAGLGPVLRFLPADTDVREILASAHMLLIPSDNEGLTLVAYEAIRSRTLVLSCDVGGQREIVAPELLLPVAPLACAGQAVAKVAAILEGRRNFRALLRDQEEALARTRACRTGIEVCLELYRDAMPAG